MYGLTPEQLWQFGAVVFTFTAAVLLLREFLSMFRAKLKETWVNTEANKNCLEVISKNLKDMAVIQAQTLSRLEKHDNISAGMWDKLLRGFDRICDLLNGKNPAIAKLQAEFKELREKIK